MKRIEVKPVEPEQFHVRCHPDLRSLVENEVVYPETLNDVIVRILAAHFNRPDLGRVPRKRMGRPPKSREEHAHAG